MSPPDYTQVGLWLAVFAVVFGLYRKVEGWRREDKSQITRDVTNAVVAELRREETARHVGPQPFKVAEEKEFVDKPSFFKHAELNRLEHARIETEFGTEMRRLEDKVEHATKEILAAGEKRAHDLHERLNAMLAGAAHTQGQLAQLVERVSEAARTANEAAKTAQAAMVEAQHKKA